MTPSAAIATRKAREELDLMLQRGEEMVKQNQKTLLKKQAELKKTLTQKGDIREVNRIFASVFRDANRNFERFEKELDKIRYSPPSWAKGAQQNVRQKHTVRSRQTAVSPRRKDSRRSPSSVTFRWSWEEEQILKEAYKRLGNRWDEISAMLPNRSTTAIQQHWAYVENKKREERRRRSSRRDRSSRRR